MPADTSSAWLQGHPFPRERGADEQAELRDPHRDEDHPLRELLGASQEELAHRSAIDRSYMSSIERGGQNPGVISIARIAGAMDMTMTELMAEAEL